jgi:LmbE family N-acetylglucosaminyl deacetylase
MRVNSILAVGAHPDDLELSCFGFLLNQNSLGSKIYAYIASPDSLTNNPKTEIRSNESIEAFKLIPNSELIIRNKNNITDNNYQEIADELRDIIINNNIDLVLIHHKDDSMQEHRLLHDITITAARRLPVSIFAYRSPSTISFMPNLIVDIKDVYDTKIKAIRKHETQFDKQYFSYDSLLIFNQSWNAKKIGIDFCEEFDILRMVDRG